MKAVTLQKGVIKVVDTSVPTPNDFQVLVKVYACGLNRSDLLEIEKSELDILSDYLPKQLSEADTEKICKEFIKNSGASSLKDMGKVMGELKKNHADTIDFSKAGQIIKNLLNGK